MQTVSPAPKQLFCKPDEAITKTASGILIEKDAAEKPKTCTVINVGSEIKHYKRDDKVIYKSYSVTDLRLNGEDFLLVAEEDVLGAVLETEA